MTPASRDVQLPWPSGLTAQHMRVGGNDERVAAIVYAGAVRAGSPSADRSTSP